MYAINLQVAATEVPQVPGNHIQVIVIDKPNNLHINVYVMTFVLLIIPTAAIK